MSLHIGDEAPDFTLTNDQDQPVTLSKLRGKPVILYFYPKDLTPGCTRQACDFRDNFKRFCDREIHVFGISKDSVKTHNRFKTKYDLPFNLLVDPNADVCAAYGVINKKSMFGKTFLGIQRSTFYIDAHGKIAKVWRKVQVKNHVEQVLNEIE